MIEIAFYGKGGIGKSTISANISAALAKQGKKVLQIGCDPKHDSTRLLLHGKNITTVLQYLKETSPDKCQLQDIVFAGYQGIHCVEAGGPEPGVGCAGRGILTTFEVLERLGIKKNQYDIIVYDVLGDVVCGGFAVPLRREYADKVYIVTSGEYMSIYAANNILRGLKNYDIQTNRAGGLIFNTRGISEEEERIKRFSEAVHLPVLETIPRSDLFSESEKNSKCLVEKYPDSIIAQQFMETAASIFAQTSLYEAKPLTDENLEEIVLHKKNYFAAPITKASFLEPTTPQHSSKQKQFFSKNLIAREPLHGCAFNGAMGVTTQLEDSISIAHGPNSCAHIAYQTMTSAGRKSVLERGIVLPLQVAPAVVSSEMNEGIMIFGGIEELKEKINLVKQYKPQTIFIISTCASGIIGDDIMLTKELEESDIKIIPILTDGNINGDYLQGILTAYIEIGRNLIDKKILPQKNTVNIIGEKPEADAIEQNFQAIFNMLQQLGIQVNCRFICHTNTKAIRNLLQGELNILAYDDYMGRTIRDFLHQEYKMNFFQAPFPVGFVETKAWLLDLASYFQKQEIAKNIIKDYESQYMQEVEELRPFLKGKKLAIITCNYHLDWILQTALDLEMEIVKVGILNSSQDNLFKTRFQNQIKELTLDYPREQRHVDLLRIKPDILLSDCSSANLEELVFTDIIPFCPPVGFFSGLAMAKRWKEIFKLNLKEGWKHDEILFKKYFC